jgi:hypothetical protein
MIKSFRGQLAHEGQDTIRLSTNQGLIGYKVVKLEIIGQKPASVTQESVVQMYTVDPNATPDGEINFQDPLLLAVGYYENNHSNEIYGGTQIIFDTVKFNQDIFITHFEAGTTAPINYYIELEQVKLSKDEATVATLKDMRGRN